jgi:leader peptidase (prepilin peptidase)/N-methyltransferase
VVRAISDGYWYIAKREGLGYGDGKLLAMIGALLGWRAVLFSLFAGSLLGSVVMVPALMIARRKASGADAESIRHVEIPFGPFLVGGAIIFLFAQDAVRAAFSFSG